jgi:POT family proton-dependent oligopeptide transporter
LAVDLGKTEISVSTVRDDRQLFGHPVGLYVLFFTEMWERFSYYGMRALLVLYMTKHLIDAQAAGAYVFGFGALRAGVEAMFGPLAAQPFASQIYGIYTGLVYFTPFFGGILADRVLGQRKTVVIGGVLMAIGHFLMAFQSMFLLALFFLILGNGAFKPNISTQVGSLYPPGDARRDGAFGIFYMGINLGAFLAPLVCGTLGQVYGWHYGFTAAGVGMMIGLCVYLWGQKYLAKDQLTKMAETKSEPQKLTSVEWKAIGGLCALCMLNVVFWGVYEQQGNTMQVFADENTNWTIAGWTMPTTWYQSLNPLFIFIFVPFLNAFWNWQARNGKPMSSVMKMAIGCFLLGASFIVMIIGTQGIQDKQQISFLWLVACTFILTIGEIYLSPIGLSLVTKVAPLRLVSMLMGMWFLSSFFGNYLSGYLGMFYSTMSRDGFFMMLFILAGVTGLVMFALQKPLKRAVGANV